MFLLMLFVFDAIVYYQVSSCTYDACEILALMVVLRSGIKLGWLIYFCGTSKGICIWEIDQHMFCGVQYLKMLYWHLLNLS